MSNDFVLDAEVRHDQGKGASRRLRRAERVPGILYGGNEAPLALSVASNALKHHLETEAFYSTVIDLRVDGRTQQVVLKDLQRHPAKSAMLHLDLLRVSDTDKIRMRVPLHFVGGDLAPGVKEGGGMETHHLTEVEVSCLARHLPEYIEVDVSHLQVGEAVHLSEMKLPEGVELVELSHGAERDLPVAAVQHKKSVEEEEVAEEAAEQEGEEEEQT